MIDWEFQQTIYGAIVFPKIWESSAVLLSLSSLLPPAWRKLGYLIIEVPIEGEFYKDRIVSIEYGNTLIKVPYSEYRLTFEPINKLVIAYPNIQIKIASFDLNMINFPAEQRETGAAIAVDKPVVTTSTELEPVNLNRHTGAIYNNTNRSIGITFNATPATLAKPSKVIPANGNIEIYADYTGAINYICAANSTGTVQVETVSYV